MVLTVIDKLRLIDVLDKTLVIVPKRVLDTEGWQRELAKWDHLSDLAIEPITGNARERQQKLSSPKPIHLINYELLPWLLDQLINCWPYDYVVPDESTRLKGHDGTWFKGNAASKEKLPLGSVLRLPDGRSVMLEAGDRIIKVPGNTQHQANAVPSRIKDFKSRHTYQEHRIIQAPAPRRVEFLRTPGLLHIATKTRRWTNLTGTPMPNGVKDLWSPNYLIDQGQRLGANITAFRETYQSPHPYVKHVYVDQPGALDRVIAATQDVTLSIKAADYLDLPELIANVIDVRLDDALMVEYKHLEDEFFLELQGHIVEAANSAVLGNKLRQFVQGAMFTDKKGAWQEVHRVKIDALRELSDEVNAPMLVAYHYTPDKERLLKTFKEAVEFNGTHKQIAAFAKGHIQHLLIHPASGGHGVEGLQDGSDTITFFGSDWSLENHDQVIERIGPTRQLQSGHPRPVFAYYLAAQNTIDEMILERLIQKKTTQEILMNAMRQRGLKP